MGCNSSDVITELSSSCVTYLQPVDWLEPDVNLSVGVVKHRPAEALHHEESPSHDGDHDV